MLFIQENTFTSGGGYPLAKHFSSTSCPSTTTTDLVELSDMTGGRRTIRGTSAVSLSVKEINTFGKNTCHLNVLFAKISFLNLII